MWPAPFSTKSEVPLEGPKQFIEEFRLKTYGIDSSGKQRADFEDLLGNYDEVERRYSLFLDRNDLDFTRPPGLRLGLPFRHLGIILDRLLTPCTFLLRFRFIRNLGDGYRRFGSRFHRLG